MASWRHFQDAIVINTLRGIGSLGLVLEFSPYLQAATSENCHLFNRAASADPRCGGKNQ
jgi:hypothetical protein